MALSWSLQPSIPKGQRLGLYVAGLMGMWPWVSWPCQEGTDVVKARGWARGMCDQHGPPIKAACTLSLPHSAHTCGHAWEALLQYPQNRNTPHMSLNPDATMGPRVPEIPAGDTHTHLLHMYACRGVCSWGCIEHDIKRACAWRTLVLSVHVGMRQQERQECQIWWLQEQVEK